MKDIFKVLREKLLLLFSCPVMSDSSDPVDWSTPGFRLSPSPGACSTNVHRVGDAIQTPFCRPLLLLPSIFPSIRVFSNKSKKLFTSGGQSITVSASASVLPMNSQDWFPLGWTGWISLQSRGLSRVFFNITVQKHQFFSTQLSLESNSHIHTWLLGKP